MLLTVFSLKPPLADVRKLKKKESIPFLILCKVKELTYTVALIKGRDKNLPPPHRLRLRRLNAGGTNRSKSLAALPKGPKGGVYYNNI